MDAAWRARRDRVPARRRRGARARSRCRSRAGNAPASRSRELEPGGARRVRERGEIHPGGQVLRARRRQQVLDAAMPPECCECAAVARGVVVVRARQPVVDDEQRAALERCRRVAHPIALARPQLRDESWRHRSGNRPCSAATAAASGASAGSPASRSASPVGDDADGLATLRRDAKAIHRQRIDDLVCDRDARPGFARRRRRAIRTRSAPAAATRSSKRADALQAAGSARRCDSAEARGHAARAPPPARQPAARCRRRTRGFRRRPRRRAAGRRRRRGRRRTAARAPARSRNRPPPPKIAPSAM